MTELILPPLKPIPIKDRVSVLFVEKGNLDVLDGAFVVVDKNGVRTHIPVGSLACLMLEPGSQVSHAAVTLASRVGCLLVWVGDGGERLYAAGQPGGACADRLLYQAKLALDDAARLKVVRKMYTMRFKEEPPERRSVDQLRGIEGVRVRKMYELLARQYRVEWRSVPHGRGDAPPARGRGFKRKSLRVWQPGRISRSGLISCEQSAIGAGDFCEKLWLQASRAGSSLFLCQSTRRLSIKRLLSDE
jgi:hypothetical protein